MQHLTANVNYTAQTQCFMLYQVVLYNVQYDAVCARKTLSHDPSDVHYRT